MSNPSNDEKRPEDLQPGERLLNYLEGEERPATPDNVKGVLGVQLGKLMEQLVKAKVEIRELQASLVEARTEVHDLTPERDDANAGWDRVNLERNRSLGEQSKWLLESNGLKHALADARARVKDLEAQAGGTT